MSAFPLIRSGRSQASYGTSRSNILKTEIQQFVGDFEVRFISQSQTANVNLVFTQINGADLSAIRNFCDGLGGATASTFTWTGFINGTNVTFPNLGLVNDTFSVNTTGPGQFNVTIPCRQIRSVVF